MIRKCKINGVKIIMDTCGTANQKTITIKGNTEMVLSEAKDVMAVLGGAILWLNQQTP